MIRIQQLSLVALRHLVGGASEALGLGEAEALTRWLGERFADGGERLPHALRRAADRSWRALEIALAGESLCSRFDRADDKALRRQVRHFLENAPLGPLPGHGTEFRQRCLSELQTARRAGALLPSPVSPGDLTRFAAPLRLIEAEAHALAALANDVRQAGYPTLAHLLELQPAPGESLLALAYRYFFRREVEADAELARGLAFAQMTDLAAAQRDGLRAVEGVLSQHGEQMDDVLDLLGSIHGGVLDVQAEQHRQGQQLDELHQAVLQALAQHQLDRRELQPCGRFAACGESGQPAEGHAAFGDVLRCLADLTPQPSPPAGLSPLREGPPAPLVPEREGREVLVQAIRDAARARGAPASAVILFLLAMPLGASAVPNTILGIVERDRHPEQIYGGLACAGASLLLFLAARFLCQRRRRELRQGARAALRRMSRARRAERPLPAPPVRQVPDAAALPRPLRPSRDALAARDLLVEAICAVAPREGFPFAAIPVLMVATVLLVASFVNALVALETELAPVAWVAFGLGMGSLCLACVATIVCRWWRGKLTATLRALRTRCAAILADFPEVASGPSVGVPEAPVATAWELVRALERLSGQAHSMRFCCTGNKNWSGPLRSYDLVIDGEPLGPTTIRDGFDHQFATTRGKHQVLVRYRFASGPTPQQSLGRTPLSFEFVIGLDAVCEVELRQDFSPGGLTVVRMS